jgi:GcrA cell cycle regulator
MSWTDERINELTRLWEQGLSASEIGKMLGVSKNAVVGKAHRLNLPARPSPIKRGANPKPRTPKAPIRTPDRRAQIGGRQAPVPRSLEPEAAPPPAIKKRIVARSGASACLWPIGDPGDNDFHFCGEPAVSGKPYCEEHCAKAYITKTRGESEAA